MRWAWTLWWEWQYIPEFCASVLLDRLSLKSRTPRSGGGIAIDQNELSRNRL
jgi:hypothetical protein